MTTDTYYSKCAHDALAIVNFALARRRGNPQGVVIWLMAVVESLLEDDKARRAEASCLLRDLADSLERGLIREKV